MTSHDVVATVRRVLGNKLKVGHLGTLDPAASGVLPLAIGAATRWISFLPPARKGYIAELTLGLQSDTHDGEGRVEAGGSLPADSLEQLDLAIPAFLGSILQEPPQVSAIRVAGKRGYERARAGEEFELKARPAAYHRIQVLRADLPRVWLGVDCGPGTYIRALARDLGRKLGCGAILSALIRTRSGRFEYCDGNVLEELPGWAHLLKPIEWPWLELPALEAQGVGQLSSLDWEGDGPRWLRSPDWTGIVQKIDGKPVLVKRS